MVDKKEHQLSRSKRILKVIYNRDEKTVLGRTCRSWALIFIYYVIAYLFLAGFFIGMISVFMYGYVPEDSPSLTGMQSILKLNPGLSFAPRLDRTHTLLQFSIHGSSKNVPYLERMKVLFGTYKSSQNNTDCQNGVTGSSFPDVPCRFPLDSLGPCSKPEEALSQGEPCVYLKLNKIFGWLPSLVNASDFPTAVIECTGQNAFDKKLLGEPVYHPEFVSPDGKKYAMIDNTYFPFINQEGYQVPLTAVQFPTINPSTLVLVECAVRGLKEVTSSVTFEITVDKVTA
ncbi:hypothetical protein P879_02190 [Paragonimus westermani]|uniref:Sodium/potassium-transporting ATPase subunit beta n=1 Tax=Paragonimus westermani TaxID=34504 RepID=A0A8T0DQC2_9TREM|nr:hypothetical protein P879_02190 [Paragonimus westermani]